MELDRKPVSPTESTGEGIADGNTLEQSVRNSSRAERRTQRYVQRGQFANAGGTADMRIRPGM